MREIVIVPTYHRPEFLYCCLEAIRVAEPTIPIHVFPDRGTDETVVCEKFNAEHHWTLPHTGHGNSMNVMEALRWAYLGGKYDRVYVIEDDAIIDPTFFTWCRDALDRYPDSFAACGWKYSPDALIGDGPDIRIPWYLSVAACIPRESLAAIVPHAIPEYYARMKNYADRMFPQSYRKGSQHYEQDGLILRVCESRGQRCVWPRRPRAIHCGWRGYHMKEGKEAAGTLEERVQVVKLALRYPDVLAGLMAGNSVPETAVCGGGCGELLLTDLRPDSKVVCAGCWHREHPGTERVAEYYYLPV